MIRTFISAFLFLLAVSCAPTLPKEASSSTQEKSIPPAEDEFTELMRLDSLSKHKVAAESIDVLLSSGPDDPRMSLIVRNNSLCNIIVDIADKSSNTRRLPVVAGKINYIVLLKGTYTLKSSICGAMYLSTKEFTDSTTIILSD